MARRVGVGVRTPALDDERQFAGLDLVGKRDRERLAALPGVAECAVIGVPHADFGEGVVAVVTSKPDASLDEAQMLRSLGSELAKYKLPKRIILADSLPRNAMGKIQKNELRDRHKATFAPAGQAR